MTAAIDEALKPVLYRLAVRIAWCAHARTAGVKLAAINDGLTSGD